MANVAITIRRNIIKSIEVSIESSSEDKQDMDNLSQESLQENSKETFGQETHSPKETFSGTTGVARPFIADTLSSRNLGKNGPTSIGTINPNLFSEKSVNLEMYENIRAPSKILDLRSLLINENADNIIFEMMENNYEMFEVDQLSGNIHMVSNINKILSVIYV